MKLIERHIGEKIIIQNLIIFYLVGLFLYFIPYTKEIFFWVLPLQLILVNAILFYHHKGFNLKAIVLFLFIFISSWLTEFFGTTYGKIFGEYVYLDSLGLKILHVPILIGLNWVMLVYASNALAGKLIKKNKVLKVILAAFLMIMYDVIIEFIAPEMRMWEFTQAYPPLKNFISWFVMALVYNSLIEIFKIHTDNKAARVLILVQSGFFLIILISGFIF